MRAVPNLADLASPGITEKQEIEVRVIASVIATAGCEGDEVTQLFEPAFDTVHSDEAIEERVQRRIIWAVARDIEVLKLELAARPVAGRLLRRAAALRRRDPDPGRLTPPARGPRRYT